MIEVKVIFQGNNLGIWRVLTILEIVLYYKCYLFEWPILKDFEDRSFQAKKSHITHVTHYITPHYNVIQPMLSAIMITLLESPWPSGCNRVSWVGYDLKTAIYVIFRIYPISLP